MNPNLSGKGVASYSVGPTSGSVKADEPSPRKALTPTSFTLPIPPTTNSLFANVKGVGRVRTKKYRSWCEMAGADLFTQKVSGTAPVPCCVSIIVVGGKGFNENRDLDNCAKGVLDLLVSQGILEGDSVKHVTTLMLHYTRGGYDAPRCRVTISGV
jgi:Holliday junction resolvase RusA-like endonuclease